MTYPAGRPGGPRSLAVVALICATAVTTGCSDDPAEESASPVNSTGPTPTSQVEPTTTPETTRPEQPEPTLPAAARGSTVRAAKAFVTYYIDLLNYAMTTGDTKAFRAASRNCEGCDRYADLFEEVADAGGSADSRGWSINEISAIPRGSNTIVLFNVRSSRVKSIPSSDSPATVIPAAEYALRLVLGQTETTWIAEEFTRS